MKTAQKRGLESLRHSFRKTLVPASAALWRDTRCQRFRILALEAAEGGAGRIAGIGFWLVAERGTRCQQFRNSGF
jgi:hypothetical protein